MSEVVVERDHSLGRDAVMARIRDIEPKLSKKFGVALDWRGDEAVISGRGVKGSARVGDTTLVLTIKLGLLLRPMAKTIREAVERAIDKALSE